MTRFEDLKPKLKPSELFSEGVRLVIEEKATRRHFVLPREALPIVKLLDGTRTLQEIVTELHETQTRFRFKTLLNTIKDLASEDFLEADGSAAFGSQADGVRSALEPQGAASFFAMIHEGMDRIRIAKVIRPRIQMGRPPKEFFYLLAGAVVFASVFAMAQPRYFRIPANFPAFEGSYAWGLLLVFVLVSALMTAKAAVQALLQIAAVGRIYGFGIRITRLCPNASVSDAAIYLSRKPSDPFVFHLASVLSLTAVAGIGERWFASHAWSPALRIVALTLTIVELNPYLNSGFRKMFSILHKDDIAAHLVPYLKKKSLLAFTNQGEKIPNHVTLALFALYSLAWSAGSLAFFAELLRRNFPALLLSMSEGQLLESFAAFTTLFLLVVTAAYFALDLLATLLGNLQQPLRRRISACAERALFSGARPGAADIEKLKQALREIELFMEFEEDTLHAIAVNSGIRQFGRSRFLLHQNQRNNSFFAIIEGEVLIRKSEPSGATTAVAVLGPGAIVGEVSALRGLTTTADVIAATPVTALVIPNSALRIAESRGEQGVETLYRRIMLDQILASAPIFKNLPRETLHLFASAGETIVIPTGTTVAEQGSLDRTFYLIVRGSVEVLVDGTKISQLDQGDFFGEISLITNLPRTATIRSLTECVLHRIRSEKFWVILARNIELSVFIETLADARLNANRHMTLASPGP